MPAHDKTQLPVPPPDPQPLIPDQFLDIPSQRLYYLSLGLLCQAIKILDFSWYLVGGDEGNTSCGKWLFVDFVYCMVLTRLRIPRLTYSRTVVFLQIALLWFLDGLMFGGISLNLPYMSNDFGALSNSNSQVLSTTAESSGFLEYLAPFTFGLFALSGTKEAHLVGQHTVRMSPISTAQLNPDSLPYCLSPSSNFVLIPVLLNNTTPAELKFSLTPPGHDVPEILELTAKDLKAIEQDRLAALRASRPSTSVRDSDEYDEYDDDDVAQDSQGASSLLQSTQSLVHIRVSRPGTLRLESLLDQSRVPVRISYPSTVNVVPCPTVEFIDQELVEDNVRCSGQDPDLELMIRVYGVPPLSLRWLKTINGRREHYLVEGIEKNSAPKEDTSEMRRGTPEEMKIPL
ncbi:hypothetical protein C0993_009482, partial [Termitomyces sp. T159_Od127]